MRFFILVFLTTMRVFSASADVSGGFIGFSDCAGALHPSEENLRVNLPAVDSARFRALVESAKKQLERSRTYADIDLSDIFTEALGRAWMGQLVPRPPSGFLRPSPFLEEQAYEIQRWAERLLKEILGERYDFCALGQPESRVSLARNQATSVDRWHIDYCLASFLLPVFGPGPEILGPAPVFDHPGKYTAAFSSDEWFTMCPDCQPRVIPRGHLVLFFGTEVGIDPLLRQGIHRSPSEFDERYLIVSRVTLVSGETRQNSKN